MKTGDIVIQIGTRHAWHNKTDQPCVMAVSLVGSTARPDPTSTAIRDSGARSGRLARSTTTTRRMKNRPEIGVLLETRAAPNGVPERAAKAQDPNATRHRLWDEPDAPT